MEENGYHYGYWAMSSELPAAAVGLWNFVEDYVTTHLRHSRDRCEARNDVGEQPSDFSARALRP